MAYKKPDDPDNRQEKVKGWLTANPGFHRPAVIAAALELPTQPVAQDCIRLWRKGVVHRVGTVPVGRKHPVTTYGIVEGS